jgi:REP element-mobilizing transposase RayT
MADKYQNKYRIPSARLSSWNYGLAATYFVTICTLQREHFFGEVIEGEMFLSEIGKIVEDEWIKTPSIRPDMKLELGAFRAMPNHFHGIILINFNQYNNRVGALHRPNPEAAKGNKFGPQAKNLASILRGFKSAVTTQARLLVPRFSWQPRFHEHIIRNDAVFNHIRQYIIDNPKNWENDTFYSPPATP